MQQYATEQLKVLNELNLMRPILLTMISNPNIPPEELSKLNLDLRILDVKLLNFNSLRFSLTDVLKILRDGPNDYQLYFPDMIDMTNTKHHGHHCHCCHHCVREEKKETEETEERNHHSCEREETKERNYHCHHCNREHHHKK